MALESATYVNDLSTTNPTGADAKSQGDDHIRLIKSALKSSFPGFTGSVLVGGVTGGSANTYTLSASSPGYTAGQVVVFKVSTTNTGASTLNINGLGAKSILLRDGSALSAGDLTNGQYLAAVYDGTQFKLLDLTIPQITALILVAVPSQTGNAGKFLTTNGTVTSWASLSDFPSGTKMPFYQASPPAGWTAATVQNDSMMRVVTAATTGGTSGAGAGHSPILNNVVPSHTHNADISHQHNVDLTEQVVLVAGGAVSGVLTTGGSRVVTTGFGGGTVTTNSQSGIVSNWQPRYMDFVIGTKS